MPTTRKTTKSVVSEILRYTPSVFKDGYYNVFKGIPLKEGDYPVSVTLITYKNKVIAVYHNGLLAKFTYQKDMFDPSVDVTGKYVLRTIVSLLNQSKGYPRLSFLYSDPDLVELLPSSILKYLGLSRESIKRQVMGKYYKKMTWEKYLHSISYK